MHRTEAYKRYATTLSILGRFFSSKSILGGAQSAKINIVQSGMGEGGSGGARIIVFNVDEIAPENSILAIVQNGMEDKAEAIGCEVLGQSPDNGYPSDALSVRNRAVEAEQAKTEYGWMEGTCGSLGNSGDAKSYWRILGGYGWYFELGQDWYQDFDPRTLAIIKAAELPGS